MTACRPTTTITVEKTLWTVPEAVKVPGSDERALIYRGGQIISWNVVD